MWGGENVVFTRIDELTFGNGVAAPQQKDNATALLRKGGDNGIGEGFPTLMLM